MTREEAEEFWASEDDARKDYPGAIRSFVGTVQHLAATERERDELRATVARVEALVGAWEEIPDYTRSQYDLGRVDQRHMAIADLFAALHPEQEAPDA